MKYITIVVFKDVGACSVPTADTVTIRIVDCKGVITLRQTRGYHCILHSIGRSVVSLFFRGNNGRAWGHDLP